MAVTFRVIQFMPLFFLLQFSSPRFIEQSRVKETGSVRFNPSNSKQISSHPRVFSYEDFLSDEECDHLLSLANREINNNTGTDMQSIFLNNGRDEIISKIEERISLWTLLPKEHGSSIEIRHYKANNNKSYYEINKPKLTLATLIMFLSNVTNGGEIIFPNSKTKSFDKSKCGSSDFAIKPKKRNAIIFFNLNLDSTEDETSIQEECPVLQGAKWSAIKYIHLRPIDQKQQGMLTVDFDQKKSLTVDFDRDECIDMDENCESWAKKGECERNRVFMLGSPDYYGTCRKSCNAC